MRKAVTLILIAVLVVVILVSGCGQPASTPSTSAPKTETLNIGVACATTGTVAFIGGHMKNGIMMAIDDCNAKGGVTIAGKKYMLNPIERDTKVDAAVGKTVVEELIDIYKTKFIAGLFAFDGVAAQPVIEENKVITFFMVPFSKSMADETKKFSYFCVTGFQQSVAAQFAFLQKFHPEVKTVAGMSTDSYEYPLFSMLSKQYAPQYGLNYLSIEKFPVTTTDFMPIIQKVLALKPDAIDTTTTVGAMSSAGILLLKQLREAGFKGPITMISSPEDKTFLEVVGKENSNGIIDIGVNADSSIVPAAYKDLMQRYEKKYNTTYVDIVANYYDTTKAFFDFLNTQDTMDTTQWTEGFAKYKWTGVFGDVYWGGKPSYGISHIFIRTYLMSEWQDGKRDTKFAFGVPDDLAGQ